MAQPARYRSQLVIMVTPHQKANVLAASEQELVSASEAARRWIESGMSADPAVTMPARQALVATIEAGLLAELDDAR